MEPRREMTGGNQPGNRREPPNPRGTGGPSGGQGLRGQRNPRDPRSSGRPLPGAAEQYPAGRPTAGRTPPPVPAAVVQAGVPHGAREGGWLPDWVWTGEKFESGLAFFADAVGRLTRFSREPADLAAARRLAGQVVLPGLVNAHAHSFHRVVRGRPGHTAAGSWDEAHASLVQIAGERLTAEEVFAVARMVFLEMLLAGVTCVGEFHCLHHQPDGTPWPEPDFLSREIARAAHEVGIRLALLKTLHLRSGHRAEAGSAPARCRHASVDQFVRETEQLRAGLERDFPPDEVWLGVAADSLAAVPLEAFKTLGAYARTHRLRLHAHVATTPADNAACLSEYGRPPIALLAEHGLLDKRFTAVDACHLTDDEAKLLGSSRAAVCTCPVTEHHRGRAGAPAEKLLAAGASLALGSDSNLSIDLLAEARMLEYRRREGGRPRGGEPMLAGWQAATVHGARSLGAPGGALEVGRPADFFTVNLFDPAIAGADPASLLAGLVLGLERRAIRDVWVGARQRIAGGRHVNHGPIVGRFVEVQKRLWG